MEDDAQQEGETNTQLRSSYKTSLDSRQQKRSNLMLFATVELLVKHGATSPDKAVSSSVLKLATECNAVTFGSRLRSLQSNGFARPVEASVTNRARNWFLHPRGLVFYEKHKEEFKDK